MPQTYHLCFFCDVCALFRLKLNMTNQDIKADAIVHLIFQHDGGRQTHLGLALGLC